MVAACPVETSPSSPPLFQDGNINFQAHDVGWIVASFFTIVAVVTSFWLVNMHLKWYTNKYEQRYIVRLLFMVPIYAVISLASYFFWNHATPLLLIRDCYESTVLTAFFYLLLTYLSPNPEDQRAILLKTGLSRAVNAERVARGEEPKKWMLPLGFIKAMPADGLYFLQIMKWGVLQYCVIRPLTTLVAVTMNYMGYYCDGSFNPEYGYVYLTVIVSVSVSVAMYCLIQLYLPIAEYLAPQKPILKLFAIKAVVFLTFWQSTFLSLLAEVGVVKNTTYMTSTDINVGIAALLETFEMMCFAFLHLKAFSYKPYRPFHDPKSKVPPPTPTPRLRSLAHAFDFRETGREIRAGWVYIMDKMSGREPTPDRGARRFAHYESAFGRPRPANLATSNLKVEELDLEKGLRSPPAAGAEYPWLRLPGDNRREKSEDLEIQINRELEMRGYGSHIPGRGHIGAPPDTSRATSHKPQRSWWRSVYSRVSQVDEDEQHLSAKPSKRHQKKQSRSRHRSRDLDADRRLLEPDLTFDDPPPPSIFASRKNQRPDRSRPRQHDELDTLAPPSNLAGVGGHRSSHERRPAKSKTKSPPPHRAISPPAAYPVSLHTDLVPVDGESLFGRIFPPSTNPSSSAGHTLLTDSELPSVATHASTGATSPSRATPRGKLVPASPQIVPEGLNSAQARSKAYLTPEPQPGVAIRSVEALPQLGGESQPPVLTVNTQPDGLLFAPLTSDVGEFGERYPRRNGAANLRRQSAQMYSPDSPSRAKRRQSVDVEVVPPQRPQNSYRPPQPERDRDRGRSSRRPQPQPQSQHRSQPQPQARYSNPNTYYEEQLRSAGYEVENMRSDITQPSFSGHGHSQQAQAKYPTVMPARLVMPGSLATPGTPGRQISNPSRYPYGQSPPNSQPNTPYYPNEQSRPS
uniref:DUF300-domain-containing protein n=1 Tax=Mycena chlorophos TaxID=658473 RepID=A0ABQ0L8F5_MYCCL|nr:predicted protein [Mycena chlorophos]